MFNKLEILMLMVSMCLFMLACAHSTFVDPRCTCISFLKTICFVFISLSDILDCEFQEGMDFVLFYAVASAPRMGHGVWWLLSKHVGWVDG